MKTTWKLTTPLLVVVSGLLTACGGGSGGDSDNGAGSGTGTTSTVSLTATVVQDTVCNTQVPASTAELVVYDNNWVIKSRHTPDASGKITATIPKTNTVNLSMITTDGKGSSRVIDVKTFAQHPIGDIGVFEIPGVSQQGCECQTTSVEVTTDLGTMYEVAQFSGNNVYNRAYMNGRGNNSVFFDNVEVCRETTGTWPTLYAATSSYEYFSAAGTLSDYDPSTPLLLVMDQSPTTYSANFDSDANYRSVMHTFGDSYISHGNTTIDGNVELFESLPNVDAYTFRAYNNRTDYYDSTEVRIGRMQRKSIAPPYNTTFNVTIPTEQEAEQLLQSMLTWLNSESNNYDLSSISNFETFSIGLYTTLSDGSRYNQVFFGPKRGTIPDDVLPADYGVEALLDENNISINFTIMRYGAQQSYQQYLASYIAASRMNSSERLLGNRSEYNAIYIDINP